MKIASIDLHVVHRDRNVANPRYVADDPLAVGRIAVPPDCHAGLGVSMEEKVVGPPVTSYTL